MTSKYYRGDVIKFHGWTMENESVHKGFIAVVDDYGDKITYDIKTLDEEPILYKHVDEGLIISRESSILESIADHDLFRYAPYGLYKGAFSSLVSKDMVEGVKLARFSREMNSIILTGYAKELMLMKTIMKKFKDKMILFAGNIGSSYVAFSYLDKRTGLCPCELYDEKIAFGYKGDKRPFCRLIVPKGLTDEIVLYLKEEFGLEFFVHVDGQDICIGTADDRSPIRFSVYEEGLLTAFQEEHPNHMRLLEIDLFGYGDQCCLFDDFEIDNKELFDRQVLRWISVFIEENKSDIDKSILSDLEGFLRLYDGTKESLSCVVGCVIGNGVYGSENMFYSRDGLYELLKGQTDDPLVFSLMEKVSKGRYDRNTSFLHTAKLKGDSLYETLSKIKYLASESECQLYAQLIWSLAKTTC